MSVILCIAIVAIILITVIVMILKPDNRKRVIKSEIINCELKQKANTPTTNLYLISIEDKRKPIELSIPKQYQPEKDMLLTYKVIAGKTRFIMLEETIQNEE
jgi:hypothetical protein